MALPTGLVASLAFFLEAHGIFLLAEKEPTDSNMALFQEMSEKSSFVTNVLRSVDGTEPKVEKSLMVDLHGISHKITNERFFRSNIYWLSPQTNFTMPEKLRFDSNFYYASKIETDSWSIRQVYKTPATLGIKSGMFHTEHAGMWTPQDGLIISGNTAVTRRNMQGSTLRVTTLPAPRFIFKENEGYSGLIADILAKMGDMSNFTIKWIPPSDGRYGSQGKDGSWNGMIGMLKGREADVSAAMLSVSLSRTEVVSFATAYLETKSTILGTDETFRSTGGLNIWGFMSVFTYPAWQFLALTLLLELQVLFIFSRRVSESTGKSLVESLFATAETSLKLGLSNGMVWDKLSSRALLMTACMFPVVVMAYYEGLLTSYLTIQHSMKLKSISDILDTGHKIVLINNSVHLKEFETAHPDSGRGRVYSQLIKDNPAALVTSVSEMDQAVLNDLKVVVVGSAVKGDISEVGIYGLTDLVDAIPDQLAFALQKDSEFYDVINHNMIQLHESGLLDYMKSKWLGQRRPRDVCGQGSGSQTAM